MGEVCRAEDVRLPKSPPFYKQMTFWLDKPQFIAYRTSSLLASHHRGKYPG
jgi:hypothetical protein